MTSKVCMGAKFGRLTVIDPSPAKEVLCSCSCGQIKSVLRDSLVTGRSKSCGCLRREITTARNSTHGLSKSPTYRSWTAMWSRCTNPARDAWPEYGMNGIQVVRRWKQFEKFLEDMGVRPTGTSLERQNNAKGYSKTNCVWADKFAQAWNRRSTVWVELRNVRQPRSVWARQLGISDAALRLRLRRMSIEEIAQELNFR